ncbi:thioesterase [marine bacterium AO1-C]|nr:thioesterase [marine bacterium AO1-C]
MQQKIEASLEKQGLMQTLGANITLVEEGKVIIECPFKEGLSQQNGYFHAGVMTSIVDSACGYAALTMMPPNAEVLTVEFKVNFLRGMKTEKVIAIGQVLKAGRTLTVCEGKVYEATGQKILANMTATMICMQ